MPELPNLSNLIWRDNPITKWFYQLELLTRVIIGADYNWLEIHDQGPIRYVSSW